MDINQQLKQTFSEARSILICLPRNSRLDNVAAALALKFLLGPEHSDVAIASAGFLAQQNLKFLVGLETIKPFLPPLKQLVIHVDTAQTPLKEFSYHTTGTGVDIYLEPERGTFTAQDVAVKQVDYKFDLIVTVGVPSLQSLGELFREAPDFFFTVPIVNLDKQPANERFGHINLVDISKTALSELLFDLLPGLELDLRLDKNLATLLLTGILSESDGLKSLRVTPQLLEKVSRLSGYQVDLPEINKKLFHTKSLNMLKLWGRVLARLKELASHKIVWSLVPHEDFEKTGTTENDLRQVIDELIISYSQAQYILLLWQKPNKQISGWLRVAKQGNALELVASFSPRGNADLAQFDLTSDNLTAAEQLVISHLQKQIPV